MKFCYACFFFFTLLISSNSVAQKNYIIKKSTKDIEIDGFLNESQWKDADIATDFTERFPVFGSQSRFVSKVKMYYDDNAVYIGAELYDTAPDSISYSLSQRDNPGNADWFELVIDPYANAVSGFGFGVTAAGVELDALASNNNMDGSWNAVWKSRVQRRDFGWSLEMKIPFSALRFPNKKVQEWNINFTRHVRRVREVSDWNPVNPNLFGSLTQTGKLTGIIDVKSPLRLSFTPYLTGYIQNSYDEILKKQVWNNRLTGGLDLKYGLNDAFTLDMTLIPDFGQTRSDRKVLNLGPFEVRYNENRPFFIEGTDLFKIGGLFYSRRIGASPLHRYDVYANLDSSKGEEVINNPQAAQMLNGTKVSGRTKKGLGIGFFNALEGRSFATIEDSLGNRREYETNPLTNYNVFVLSQNLKNNSTVSLVNTNVTREGNNRDANVTLGQAVLYSPDGKYGVTTTVALSAIKNQSTTFGHTANVSIGKVSGIWQYGFNYSEKSDTYNPNDLGFLYNNNTRNYIVSASWNGYKPSKYFFRRSVRMSWVYEELYKPQRYSSLGMNWSVGGLHKKQTYMVLSGNILPFGTVNHFESRHFGHIVRYNPNASVSYFFTTDYSKRFALDGRISYTQFFGVEQNQYGGFLSPRIRVSNRMNIVLNSSVNYNNNGYGFVNGEDPDYADDIILGIRKRLDVENSIQSEFIFTKRMGVDLRLRHYWSQVEYNRFVELGEDGAMTTIDYDAVNEDGEYVHNTNYNAFTIDVNYKWVFIPGSQLKIVYKNNIFASKSMLESSYFQTFNTLFNQPQVNSISLKLLVYVDVLYFQRKNRKQRKGPL